MNTAEALSAAAPAAMEQPAKPASRPRVAVGRLAQASIGALLLCQATACWFGRAAALAGRTDLRAFYATGFALRSGMTAQLYAYGFQQRLQNALVSPRAVPLPFLYPPFAALPFAPLSMLPFGAAFIAQIAFNLALLAGIGVVLQSSLPALRQRSRWLLPALFACLFPVSVTLLQGQVSILLLALYTAAYLALCRRRNVLAGLLLALALIKFQLVLPVILLFALWRNARLLAGFFTGAIALAAVSYNIAGPAALATYVHLVLGIGQATTTDAAAAQARYGMFPTTMANLHGLTFALSGGAAWGTGLNVALCVGVLAWAWRQRPSLLVALPAAMLVSFHMQPHDLTLLALPLAVALDALLRDPEGSGTLRIAWAGGVLLLTFPVAPLLMACHCGFLAIIAVALALFSFRSASGPQSTASAA